MLIDNRIAVVGSLALAALSLDFRREVAITVTHRASVSAIGQFFETVAAARPARRAARDGTGTAAC